jgi:UPF0716 protein FxsA
VGSVIGAFPTVLAVVFTAVLGVFLIRLQGFSTMQKAQAAMQAGQVPAIEMIEGAWLLIAAILLLIPGFATDSIGFVLLIPPVRKYLSQKSIAKGLAGTHLGGADSWRSGNFTREDYFEGEYEHLTPEQQHETNQHRLKQKVIIEGEVEIDKKD